MRDRGGPNGLPLFFKRYQRSKVRQRPAAPDAGGKTYLNALRPIERSMNFSTWRRGTGSVRVASKTPFRTAIGSIIRMILPTTDAFLRRWSPTAFGSRISDEATRFQSDPEVLP